jgi:hypothetical protein
VLASNALLLSAGPTLNASFSSAKGAYAGEEVSHRGTVLAGGGTTKVVTSGTLTLDGAQLVGNRVEGDVGHLVLASRQDTATYSASHKSVGASVWHNPASAKPSPARLLQNRTGVRRPLADYAFPRKPDGERAILFHATRGKRAHFSRTSH